MSRSEESTDPAARSGAVASIRDDPSAERLLTGASGRLLAVTATASMTSIAGRITLSPLLPSIMADLAISPARAGVALSLMAGLSALLRFPGGRVADALSRKTVLTVGMGVWIVGFALLSATPGYPGFVLATAVVGVGTGLYLAAAAALISELFVSRRGLAFGFNTAMINLGGVLASGLAVVALAFFSWRAAFLPVAAVIAITLVLMHRWNPEPYVVSRVRLEIRPAIGRLLRIRPLRRALVAFTAFAFVWQGTVNFLPTYLQVEKGFGPATASTAFASLFVVGMLVNPVAGRLGDRYGYTRVAAVCPVVGAAGLGTIVLGSGLPAVGAGLVLFAAGLSSFWPVMSAYAMDVIPDANLGGDYGALSMLYIGLGSLGPTVVGVIAERFAYTHGFAVLAVIMLGSVGILASLRGER